MSEHTPSLHPDSGYATAKLDGALTDQMVTRFKETPGAWEFYQEQPPGYRRQTARWVTSAKREETQERRLATLIDDSRNRLRIKQLRKAEGLLKGSVESLGRFCKDLDLPAISVEVTLFLRTSWTSS